MGEPLDLEDLTGELRKLGSMEALAHALTVELRATRAERDAHRPTAETCQCLGCSEWRALGGWRRRAERAEAELAEARAERDALIDERIGAKFYAEPELLKRAERAEAAIARVRAVCQANDQEDGQGMLMYISDVRAALDGHQ